MGRLFTREDSTNQKFFGRLFAREALITVGLAMEELLTFVCFMGWLLWMFTALPIPTGPLAGATMLALWLGRFGR